MKPASFIEVFLRRQRRRSRGTLLLWSAAAALALPAWVGGVQLGWFAASRFWAALPGVLSLWLLVRWYRRVRHLDGHALAQEIDARWALRARIESTVELALTSSAMAVEQRADATRQLREHRPFGTLAWVGSIACTWLLLGLIGFEQVLLHRPPPPSPFQATAIRPAPARRPVVAPPEEPLQAAITWTSPAHSLQARINEEIPLLAHATSNKGFRAISLEVALNGTPLRSYPLTAADLGAPVQSKSNPIGYMLIQPGAGDLNLTLFLDETGAEVGDVVSYFLRGEANFPPDFPAVNSPLQFVEVIPADPAFHDESRFGAEAQEMLRRLRELKQAQTELIGRNFRLTPPSPAAPARSIQPEASPDELAENEKVATAQTQLTLPTEEARSFAIRIRAPSAVSAQLAEAGPFMTQAGSAIAARENEPAAALQAQALARIVAAERAFLEAQASQAADADADSAAAVDPVQLPPRGETPAGRLEQLAEREAENNRKLQELDSAFAELPMLAAEQAAVARELERLAAEHALVPDVQKSVEESVRAATEAARQLGLGDPAAARAPSAETQALLQHAVAAQEKEGRVASNALLAQIRREVANAAHRSDPSAAAQANAQARRELRAEAKRQQQQGSADSAAHLAALANQSPPPDVAATPSPSPSDSPSASASPPSKSAASQGQAESTTPGTPPPDPVIGKSSSGPKLPPPLQPSGSGYVNTTYEAKLQPLPEVGASRAAGVARLSVNRLTSIVRLTVNFGGLGSRELAAAVFLADSDGKLRPVRALGLGQISSQTWSLDSNGELSLAKLLAALTSGGLSLRIDTANHPAGELEGQFVLPAGKAAEESDHESDAAGGGSGHGGMDGSVIANDSGDRERGSQASPHIRVRDQAGAAPIAVNNGPAKDGSLPPDLASAETIRRLKAAAALLTGPNDGAAGLALLVQAAQQAQGLVDDAGLGDTAHNLARGADTTTVSDAALAAATRKTLADQAIALAKTIEESHPPVRRDEWTRRFRPEDIDPNYRKPVEDYFEQLSRTGAPR